MPTSAPTHLRRTIYKFKFFLHFLPFTLYISYHMMYSMCEQSRKPRVKCHRDGELPGGRRNFSTMGFSHPLRHNGFTSFMKQRYSVGRMVGCFTLPFPTGDPTNNFTPLTARRQGIFYWQETGEQALAPSLHTYRRFYYDKNPKIHCFVPPSILQGLLA